MGGSGVIFRGMMRLRVVVPAGLTESVLDVLDDEAVSSV